MASMTAEFLRKLTVQPVGIEAIGEVFSLFSTLPQALARAVAT